MSTDDSTKTADALRKRAEAFLAEPPRTIRPDDLKTVRELLQELSVHQGELELQNEELRDTQLALERVRDRFAALYERAPVGYVVLDASGLIRQTNATWRAMLHRETDDFKGMPFAQAIVSEDAPVFLARFRAFFRNPAEKEIVVRIKRRGGPPFHARIEAKPRRYREEIEEPDAELMVIVSDISDLHQAQQQIEIQNGELRKTNDRLARTNAILRAIRNVNQLITQEDDPIELIKKACGNLTQTMGYLNAWIALLSTDGMTVWATAASGFTDCEHTLSARLETGDYPECMTRALDRDETVLVVDPKAHCPECPASREHTDQAGLSRRLYFNGKTYGVLTVSIPIAYIQDTEEQALFAEMADDLGFALHKIDMGRRLQEGQRRYQEIFDRSRDGFVMVDADGRIFDANQAYCDMLGYSLEELKHLEDFYRITPEAWREWEATEIWEKRLLGRGYSGLYEKEYIRKDGTVFPAELRSYTVRGEDGAIDYFWGTARDITERKQAEETIRRNTERLKAVIEILQYRSESVQDFLDYAMEKAIALTQSKIGYIYFYDEDRREFILNTWSKDVMKACSIANPETRYELDKTGIWGEAVRQRRPILINDFQVHNPLKKGYPKGHAHLTRFLTVPVFYNDRIVAVVGVANKPSDYGETDALELTLLMDSVWKSVESMKHDERIALLGQMLDEAPASITIHDTQGRFLYANRETLVLHGYDSLQEFLSVNLHDLDVPESEALLAERFRKIAETGEARFEVAHFRKDGSTFPLEVMAKAIQWHGEPAILSIAADVAERKRAEEALRESEERNRLLSNVTLEGILIHKDGIAMDVNASLAQMLGFEREDLIGRNFMDFIHEDDRAMVRENIAREIAPPYIIRAKRRSGEEFFAEIESRNFRKQGEMWRVSAVRDITERKRADEERQKLQDQLNQAQKLESIGRLAGGVAHDFNNMLTVILGQAEMALMQMGPESPLRQRLMQIQQSAERSTEIVRQLLAFARKQVIRPLVLDLNGSIEKMLRMLGRLIGEDIHLVWGPGPNLWPILMDPSQMDQILVNLCVNARDAIADVGTVTIETHNVVVDADYCAHRGECIPGEYVLLSVSDDGSGMDKDVMENLFDPFFTTKEPGKGTGLGLATVYGIVSQNSGFINVYSEPGQGTVFRIYLPRHKGDAGELWTPKNTGLVSEGHETILLVEDEPMLLDIGKSMLERLGYTVMEAATPEAAIAVAEKYADDIHLLMTDVILPGMNGRDLAERMLARYPGIKCLFMSGYTAEVIGHHGVLDPEVHFIQKPFTLQALSAKLREVLEEE
jgi:two-component system, cell cycle sensor histidine kinase and response regulator CckA